MRYVQMFGVLLILNALDIVIGLIAALREKELMSSKLRDGLFKKMGFIFCYILAFLIDERSAWVGVHLPVTVSPALAGYVFLTEIISIIENIARVNPTLVPDKLLELFHVKHFGGPDELE